MDEKICIILGLVLGIGLMFLCTLSLGNEVIQTRVLEEACHKIYGNDTHWIDDELGTELHLVCETNKPIIDEEPKSEELIVLRE